MVRSLKPRRCVEIGCLHGYSTIFISAALRANGLGHLLVYDLWEKFEFSHVPQYVTQANLRWAGQTENVALAQMDALEVPKYVDQVDFLHIDISNHGDVFRWAMDAFRDKLTGDGLIVLEGGSKERDQEGWMVKYNAPSIVNALEGQSEWQYYVYDLWPSLTVMWRGN